MYKLYFPKNFENKNNNFKINSIKNLENYLKKLKNKLIYDTSRLLQQVLCNKLS